MHRLRIDDYDDVEFADVAASFPANRFGYVVTPNVDHLVRYCADGRFRSLYEHAAWVLLDSRFLAHILRAMRGQRIRVCPGSDLTPRLLQQMTDTAERVVLVGGTATQVQRLTERFRLNDLLHIDPPMGFIHQPEQLEQCLRQIEAASPFRYCLLAVGSPQQEELAYRLQQRGHTRGLALCVGASINFLTGVERRAPRWLQRSGLEWAFRLAQSPRRLAARYLLRGPRIFRLLPRLRFMPQRRSAVGAGAVPPESPATRPRAPDTSGTSARGLWRG